MEISAPVPRQVDWRRATLIAGAVAAFELALLLIVGVALLAKPLSAHARDAAAEKATGIEDVSRPEPKATTLARGQTRILVLNGNGIAGAAAETASRVRARGYPVSETANAAASYGQSVVMYRPGRLPEAKRLSTDLGIKLVGPLDGVKLSRLHRAQLVVVVGSY